MPLHDTGEQAGSRLGISLVSTKIRNRGRRCEAHHVRRRNENARESVSRKVCRVFTNIFIIFVALTIEIAVVDEGEEYFVKRVTIEITMEKYLSFHAFHIRSIIKTSFISREVCKARSQQRIESYLDLVKGDNNRFPIDEQIEPIKPNK